ncbi:MAG TPA: hypothetical protein PKY77_05880 [Phycisphaerae bacterium]|nr:hypothetical protein [Phycisphaerae bacterium]HRY69026.1 hypothetical protein [Phycisphaerae bacterium]HSA25999.1 hypothetical protein [Phycisphaerae bacterium]
MKMTRMSVVFLSVVVLTAVAQAANMHRAEEVSNIVAGHLAKLQSRSYSAVTTVTDLLPTSTGKQRPYLSERLNYFAIRASVGFRVDLVTDAQKLKAAGLADGNVDPHSMASWSYAAATAGQSAVECRVALGPPDKSQYRTETYEPYWFAARNLLIFDPIGMLFLTHDGAAGVPIWGSQPKPDGTQYQKYLAGEWKFPQIVLGAETDTTLEVDYKVPGKTAKCRFVLDKKRGLYPIKSTMFYPDSEIELVNTVTEVIAWGKHGDLEYPAQIKRTFSHANEERDKVIPDNKLIVVTIVDGTFSLNPPTDRAHYAEAKWTDPVQIQRSVKTRKPSAFRDKIEAGRAKVEAAKAEAAKAKTDVTAPAK